MMAIFKADMKDKSLPPQPATNTMTHTSAVAQEKHDRMARKSLQDMLHFSDMLESEITRLQAQQDRDAKEQELLQRMLITKSKFDLAMRAMREPDSDASRHALIRFADSVQDIIAFIHRDK